MRTLLKITINGLALWAAAALVHGITLAEGATSTSSKVLTILVIAALFGLVNALVRPVAKFFGFPFLVLTLGLFIFVINAAMLALTSWLAGVFGLDFHVDQFWPTAVLGALVVTFVSWVLGLFFDTDDDTRRPAPRGYDRRGPGRPGGPTMSRY